MVKFLDNLISKFSTNHPSVLGIDIGSSSIKIVQLKRSGSRAVLETYGELALGPYAGFSPGQATSLAEEKVTEALGDILKEKDVNITTNLCGVSIPFASSLMTVIQLPASSEKDLANIMPIEVRKYIPVPVSEVTLDWSVIPRNQIIDDTVSDSEESLKPKDSNMDVLVVAIHNDTLKHYSNIISKNNLQSSFSEIEVFSIMRSVLDNSLDPVFIFDFGSASTKFFIIERGVLLSSHTVNMGSQNITMSISKSFGISLEQAEITKRKFGLSKDLNNPLDISSVVMLTLEYIFNEAQRTIINYEKRYNKSISKIVMVGGGSSLKGIDKVAEKHFQTTVELGNPFSKVVAPAFLEKVLKDTAPEFAVSVGLALRKLQEFQ
jgi:type IV pilus assembly protein PilM